MSFTEQERSELLGGIGAAFLAVFTEEDRARTSEFQQEMKEHFGGIDADRARISEIESSADGHDRLMVTLLRGRIDAHWKEIVLATEQRGSLADRKYIQFMALIFPSFGITDFPSLQDPDAKLLMELLSRPSPAAN